jgi:hypothetical protein
MPPAHVDAADGSLMEPAGAPLHYPLQNCIAATPTGIRFTSWETNSDRPRCGTEATEHVWRLRCHTAGFGWLQSSLLRSWLLPSGRTPRQGAIDLPVAWGTIILPGWRGETGWGLRLWTRAISPKITSRTTTSVADSATGMAGMVRCSGPMPMTMSRPACPTSPASSGLRVAPSSWDRPRPRSPLCSADR